jgi:hypothetical protein
MSPLKERGCGKEKCGEGKKLLDKITMLDYKYKRFTAAEAALEF